MIVALSVAGLIAIALLYQLGAARKAKRERLNSPTPTPHWQRSNEMGWDSSYD